MSDGSANWLCSDTPSFHSARIYNTQFVDFQREIPVGGDRAIIAIRRMDNPRKPGEADRLRGEILREARRLKGITQDRVASYLGISQQQYRKYETGRSRLTADRWLLLCRLMNIDQEQADKRIEDMLGVGGNRTLAGAGVEEEAAPYVSQNPLKNEILRRLDELKRLVGRM